MSVKHLIGIFIILEISTCDISMCVQSCNQKQQKYNLYNGNNQQHLKFEEVEIDS